MIKKIMTTVVCIVLLVAGLGFLFKEQLWETLQAKITADMYVEADTDGFDPGLSIGERFPAINALHQDEQVTSIERFVKDRGMIFIANRSADW